jgi:hypothetical protein
MQRRAGVTERDFTAQLACNQVKSMHKFACAPGDAIAQERAGGLR